MADICFIKHNVIKWFNCLSLFLKAVDKPNIFLSQSFIQNTVFYSDSGDEMNLRESVLIKMFITGFQQHEF